MTKFMVLYRSTMTASEQMAAGTPAEMQAGMEAWTAWGTAAGDHLVDFGSPAMPTSEADPGPAGWIGGYSLMQADDLAAVNAVLADHPHKAVGTIEVLELLPIPGS